MLTSLTNENIETACTEIEEYTKRRKAAREDAIRIRLSLEEVLLSYQKAFGEEAGFRLETGGSFGRSMIRLTIPGSSLDPFEESASGTDEDSLMQSALIRMGKLPRWRYRRSANEIVCTFTKKKPSEWVYLLFAIVAAVVLGLLVRLSPESVQVLLRDGIISPLVNTFMSFLNAIAGPMIFLSVVWGIYSIGDAATFSRLGKGLLARFGCSLLIMITICALISLPFFSLQFGVSQSGSDFSQLYLMILNIIPGNLFTPFIEGNTLQILFIASITGIVMLIHGKNTQNVADLSEQLGLIVNFIMMLVSQLVPVFVFGSLFNIIVSSEVSSIIIGGKFFFGTVIGSILIILMHTALVCLRLKMSPFTLWEKTLSTFLICLSTASSSAAFSDNIHTCIDKFGLNRRIVNFGVPFAQILYKPSSSVMFWCAAISAAENSDSVLSLTWLITTLIMCILLSSATPPVPGGMNACFSVLFTQLHLPLTNLVVILALASILDFVTTAANIFSGQCILAITAGDFDGNS